MKEIRYVKKDNAMYEKTVTMKKPFFIDFEGLDCSFKETNSKRLVDQINSEGKFKAVRFEFPNYLSESSCMVKTMLSGEYIDNPILRYNMGKPTDGDISYAEYNHMNSIKTSNAIASMYMADMYHTLHTEIAKAISSGVDVIVTDRWWYSNLYYNANCNDLESIKNIMHLAIGLYDLPEADYVFFIHNSSSDIILEKLAKKKNKDIFECNKEYINATYNNYSTLLDLLKNGNCIAGYKAPFTSFTINIDKLEGGKLVNRGKEGIFNSIMNKYNSSILPKLEGSLLSYMEEK